MFIFIIARYLPFRREAVLFVTIPTDDKQHHTASYIYTKKKANETNTNLIAAFYSIDIPCWRNRCPRGESIHDALRQAREWRRTNDPRCKGGITITLKAGRYFMQEPLFLRPEDSGTKESPLVIRGIGEKHTSVICGDARQRHTQVWPLKEQGDSLPIKNTMTVFQ